jgi:hypothetical protein
LLRIDDAIRPEESSNDEVDLKLLQQLIKLVKLFDFPNFSIKGMLKKAEVVYTNMYAINQSLVTLEQTLDQLRPSPMVAKIFKNNLKLLRNNLVSFKKMYQNLVPANTVARDTPAARAAAAGFVKDNLADAIQSRNEIYVSGDYYAVRDISKLGKYLKAIIQAK